MGILMWKPGNRLERVAQTPTKYRGFSLETSIDWFASSILCLTKPLCDPTLWAFCQSYRAWEDCITLILHLRKTYFRFGIIGCTEKSIWINCIRCLAPAQYGSLWDSCWNLILTFYQTGKSHATSATCSSLTKIGLDPWFVTAGYHRTIAKQFTQRSGHHQTDHIDWKETRKILETFHQDEQSLI